MADDQPQVPGSNDELDKLVKQCEAAAEAVTVAKRNGDKPRIDADVKALVALKEQITAIAPDHPLALKDKKKAKKGGGSLADALAAAMATRKKNVRSGDSDDESSGDWE